MIWNMITWYNTAENYSLHAHYKNNKICSGTLDPDEAWCKKNIAQRGIKCDACIRILRAALE
jgi:hypothetical protein